MLKAALKSHEHLGTCQRQHKKFTPPPPPTPICQPLQLEDHLGMACHFS